MHMVRLRQDSAHDAVHYPPFATLEQINTTQFDLMLDGKSIRTLLLSAFTFLAHQVILFCQRFSAAGVSLNLL